MAGNRDRRIDRLLPTLGAQERAIFVLRQYKAGATASPVIGATMPRTQIADFNRYIRLMNAVNCDLRAALLLLGEQVHQLGIKYGWLLSLVFLGGQIEDAGYQMLRLTKDRALRREIRNLIAKSPGSLTAPVDLAAEPESKDEFGSGLVRALLAAIGDGLDSNWRELRAIELVVDEVAEEFGGEDPLRADNRELLDGARATCLKLCEDIRPCVDGVELVEPTDQAVETVRIFVTSHADAG
jgi:hypothetical protein